MKYSMCFFPLIGLVIGAMECLWFLLMGERAGTLFAASVGVLIPVVVSGGIHLDGMLDTSDALSSYKSQEEKLEILKDSHAGAFAIIVGICYFILSLGLYSEMNLELMKLLGLSFFLSRTLSALAVVSFPLAKNTGLAATFSDMAVKKVVACTMVVFLVAGGAAMVLINPIYGIGALVAAGLTFLYYHHMAVRKFGGITGDLAGFFLCFCELFMMLAVVVLNFVVG